MICTNVEDQQLLSMKKQLKKSKKSCNEWLTTVRFVATSVSISTGSVYYYTILTENLLIKKVSAWWVPHQKAYQVEALTSLLRLFNKNPDTVSWFLTVDESWLHHFDPESKSKVWPKNTPLLHLLKVSCSCTESSGNYSAMLRELYWLTILSMAASSQKPITPVWSQNSSCSTEPEETWKVA